MYAASSSSVAESVGVGEDIEDGEEFELLDVHKELTARGSSLQLSPGLSYWKVPLMVNQTRKWGPKADPNYRAPHLSKQQEGSSEVPTEIEYLNQGSWWADELETYVEKRSAKPSQEPTQQEPTGWLPPGLKRSMFPASGEFADLNQELQKCARVLPHKQVQLLHEHSMSFFTSFVLVLVYILYFLLQNICAYVSLF